MYQLFRKLLFLLPAETAHEFSLESIAAAERLGLTQPIGNKVSQNPVNVMGLDFKNPVGLAAGLDKNANCLNGFGSLGFGFVEVGTVTPRPQPGNPKPRMFRLTKHQAIINRLGFNNLGVDYLVEQVKKRRYQGVLGINIGKNFDTPIEKAVDDYLICLNKVYEYADYITVNISSPNTPGLRDLQGEKQLADLLGSLIQQKQKLEEETGKRVPLAVKIAPDMDDAQIEQTAKVLLEQGVDGVIATNTTLAREAVKGSIHADEAGGLSGAPLFGPSTEFISKLAAQLNGRLPIIAVGGICSGEDAKAKIQAGASLVQIYTGFIYQGPKLIKEAVEAIASLNRS